MKRILLFVIAVLGVQATMGVSRIRFGAGAGLNFQTIDLGNARAGDYKLSAESKTGYFAGVEMSVGVKNHFWITPRINYNANSYTLSAIDVNLEGSRTSATVRMNSLEVPVIFSKTLLPSLSLELGPLFNVWNQTTVSGVEAVHNAPTPISVDMIRPSVGYMAGLTFILGPIWVSGGYKGDFSRPIQAIGLGNQITEIESGIQTWMLAVGLRF